MGSAICSLAPGSSGLCLVRGAAPVRRSFAAMNGKGDISVERIYQKKTQLEHILLRPDTYIGSVEPLKQPMWVYDGEESGMVHREVSFVPGLYKIFDEIIVNAADHKQRDKNMDVIKVDIDPEANKVVIYNNGRGIDVVMHKVEKVYVPTLIFGHLLTGANFDDDEKKTVGGRNGYGAKLCNIFSTKFTIETSSKKDGKQFRQTWQDNMAIAGDIKITDAAKEDFTRVTFYPDLAKFNMEKLDQDIVALMSRRAYDIAGTAKGVRVYLNGQRLPIKGFKDYVDQYLKGKTDEVGNPLTCQFESCGPRWEIAVALSEKGFQQVSFVNSIATTKGGRHVDYVTNMLLEKVAEAAKKNTKKDGLTLKPFQLKNFVWIFINCLIDNPAFDSQTKDNLNTQVAKFGSKCTPTEKFFAGALKTGIMDAVMNWAKFKAESLKDKMCSKSKHSKIKGMPKLDDANDAGTKNSLLCTLILTEGDSAKALVTAGFSVLGRDRYGVFPLKGKLLNVREATSKQISENAEITAILKIMGLQYRKKYESVEDMKTLRYGKLMIMTDQDPDGSHIKGLLINFIHHNWPSLLKMNFLEEFITPIVKVSMSGKDSLSFFSLPEFDEWKKATPNWPKWTVKYYKGLGTSDKFEAEEYFEDLQRHRIRFKYEGLDDDNAINLAFSKKMIDARKDWLTGSMESRKMRRELGLSEVYLYAKDTKSVTYKDFVNKELVLFSNLDNERSIPSVMDGLKPGQRKVLFTCFKRNDKKEVKVAQLAGSVSEMSAYHHGEASLMQTIIGLAQNFVGSNNINLLLPNGMFGSRGMGGKDAASPRYIFTELSKVARRLFHADDRPLLNYLKDDNLTVEPEYYVPIIPMVLVNGAEGIGTGWSTKIPNYNPRDIVANLKRMLRHEDPVPLKPWFKGFRGEIAQVESARFVVNGEVAELDNNKLEITELPIRTWTTNFKEQVLDVMLNGTEKVPQCITDYKEYHTHETVRFVVVLPESTLRKAEAEGVHKYFKLQTTFTTNSMVLFDSKGCLRRYESPEEILKEFYDVRLDYYDKRKTYRLGKLQAEADRLTNQARFIREKVGGKIVIENKKRAVFVKILVEAGFDPDPVLKWQREIGEKEVTKKKNNNNDAGDDDDDEKSGDEENENESEKETNQLEKDYDYLMNMPMKSMLLEKQDELLRKKDDKLAEISEMEQTKIQDIWLRDLDAFLVQLEKEEKEEAKKIAEGRTGARRKKGKEADKPGKIKKVSEESKPSPFGQRIPPKVDFDAFTKKEAKSKAKKEGKPVKGAKVTKKTKKNSGSDTESDDDSIATHTMKRKSYSDDDETILEDSPEKPAKKTKTVTLDKFLTKKAPAKKEEKAPIKVEEAVLSSDSDSEKAAKAKKTKIDDFFQKSEPKSQSKYRFSESDEESDESVKPKKKNKKAKNSSDDDWDSSPKKKTSKKKDSGSGEPKAKPKPKPKAAAKTKSQAQSKPTLDMDDELGTFDKSSKPVIIDSDDDEVQVEKNGKAAAAKNGKHSDSESEDQVRVKKVEKPKAKKPEKKAKKSMFETSSEDEDELKPLAERIKSPIGATTGRQRKPVTYNYGGDSDSE